MAWYTRLANVFRREQVEAEVRRELEFHVRERAEELLASGMSERDAHRLAQRELGHSQILIERTADVSVARWLELTYHDLRCALREFRRSPLIAGTAILTLAIGIAATAALFSVVDALYLRPLPVSEPEQLVRITSMTANGPRKRVDFDFSTIRSFAKISSVFSGVAAYGAYDVPSMVSVDRAAEQDARVIRVTGNFFPLLGINPAVGRVSGNGPTAILSNRFWKTRLAEHFNVIGRRLSAADHDYPIIGVARPAFSGLSMDQPTDVWLIDSSDRFETGSQALEAIARLHPGVTLAQAQSAVQSILSQSSETGSADGRPALTAVIEPAGKGFTNLRGRYQESLWVLTGMTVLLLLVTCANTATLLVAKNVRRDPEMTLRSIMGAQRSRLISQLLVEGLLVALLGGTLALLLAKAGVGVILALLPEAPAQLEFQANGPVIGFLATATLLSACLSSIAPAWRVSRVDLVSTHAAQAQSTLTRSRKRLDHFLLAAQVALSVVLLTTAGLFLQTLENTASIDAGFDYGNVVQVRVDTRSAGYGIGAMPVRSVHQLLKERIEAIPGVESVAASRNPLMSGISAVVLARIDGSDYRFNATEADPGIFETLRIPLVRGRFFSDIDADRSGPKPVVVSESFVQQFFPDTSPIGRSLSRGDGTVIVGVADDAKVVGLRAEDRPMVYFDLGLRRQADRISAILVRTSSDPDVLVPAIARAVRSVDPRLLVSVETLQGVVERSMARERLTAALSSFFGLVSMFLAAIGLFGLASLAVARRTKEIGIRLALGAGRRKVLQAALNGIGGAFGLGLVTGGIAVAILARIAGTFIEGLLFGLQSTDTRSLAIALVGMTVVAVIACLAPACRALRVDPLTAIRYD